MYHVKCLKMYTNACGVYSLLQILSMTSEIDKEQINYFHFLADTPTMIEDFPDFIKSNRLFILKLLMRYGRLYNVLKSKVNNFNESDDDHSVNESMSSIVEDEVSKQS